VLKGASTVKTAIKYGDAQSAVSNWVRRYQAGGADALNDAPRSGRPSKLSPQQVRRIEEFVTHARAESLKLSGRALAEFIKSNFGVSLTRQHTLRILDRLQ